MQGRNIYANPSPTGEGLLIKVFLFLSISAHFLLFNVDYYGWLDTTKPIIQEWSIDTDLMTDEEFDDLPSATSIPDAKPAPVPKVPDRLLPQLPKKYNIKEEKVAEDGLGEPDEKKKEGKEDKAEPGAVVKNQQEDNKLEKRDALKRLMLEKIRAEQKEASQKLVAEQNEFAKLAQKIKGRTGKGIETWRQSIRKAITRKFNLPLNMEGKALVALVQVKLNTRGRILAINLVQSSGDQLYDRLAIDTVKNAEPFKPPPESFVGKFFTLKIDARTL